MALGEITKQLAQQALLSATTPSPEKPAAAPHTDNLGEAIFRQIGAMQKALKDDEELVILFQHGSDRIRILEIYMPTWRLAVLGGVDQDRSFARALSPVEALQLVLRVAKVQPGAKPSRVALVAPKN